MHSLCAGDRQDGVSVEVERNRHGEMTSQASGFKSVEQFFDKYLNLFGGIIIALTAFFGMLLFNLRVDEGGDDSTYICRAIDFLREGRYPNYQGPLYPMFLALLIKVFGQSLFALKLSSLVFILVGQTVFFLTLRKRISSVLLLSVLALLSINSSYLYFASQTFSEALFILIEYVFFALAMRFEASESKSVKDDLLRSLPVALAVLLAFLTRTIGIGFGIVGIAYLCLRKQWRKAAVLLASLVLLIGVWYGLRYAVWGSSAEGGSTQFASLTQVDPYDASHGKESLAGYVARFTHNSNLYFSKHLLRFAGFKAEMYRDTSGPLTFAVYVCFLFGAVQAFRRNRYVFFMAVNVAVMLGISFIILQIIWDQVRLVLPYLAMLYTVTLYGLYQLLSKISAKVAGVVLMILVFSSGLMSFSQTRSKIDISTLRKNLGGDMLYGYTADWYNYLFMCQLANDVCPEDAYIACRKPNMARIYCNGRKFFGIYTLPSEDPDELVDFLRNKGVTNIVLASLRRDPLNPGQGIINTIHRYMNFVCQKYPDAFLITHQIGNAPDAEAAKRRVYEPAYLIRIDYDYIDSVRAELSNNE